MDNVFITLKVKLGTDVQTYRFDLSEPVLIGRKPECDITIPDARVSRSHAIVFGREHKIFLANLSDKNPVFFWDKYDHRHLINFQQELILNLEDIFQISEFFFKLSAISHLDLDTQPIGVTCPHCGGEFSPDLIRCPNDGALLPESPTIFSDYDDSHSQNAS